MKSRIVQNPLLARLRAVTSPAQVPAPGFKTAAAWAKEWMIHEVTAARLLRKGVKAGVMQCRMYRIRVADGRVCPSPHYAEK